MNVYNSFVNTGQFGKAANATLTSDVKYIIPGPIDLSAVRPGPEKICPYCGTFNGRTEVLRLFNDGFLGHFTIVNPLVNLRQIACDSCGAGGLTLLLLTQFELCTGLTLLFTALTLGAGRDPSGHEF